MAWTSQGHLKGDKGDKGDAGSGVTIAGSDTWAHINGLGLSAGDKGMMYILTGTTVAGAPASGAGAAKAGDGLVWDGTKFTNVGPVRGPVGPAGGAGATGAASTTPGPAGARGAQIFFGTGAPGDSANTALLTGAQAGDVFIDKDPATGKLYQIYSLS